jgi:hypothetical protein
LEKDKLVFETMENAIDERFKSFVMIAHQDNLEIASIAHYEGEWSVGLYTRDQYIRVPWKNFLEMFSQFNLFMLQENQAMLEEAEELKRLGDET